MSEGRQADMKDTTSIVHKSTVTDVGPSDRRQNSDQQPSRTRPLGRSNEAIKKELRQSWKFLHYLPKQLNPVDDQDKFGVNATVGGQKTGKPRR